MSFFTGLLTGVNKATTADREDAQRREDLARERERNTLKMLIESDDLRDPALREQALYGYMQLSRGERLKKGFFDNLLGRGADRPSPEFQSVMDMVQRLQAPPQDGGEDAGPPTIDTVPFERVIPQPAAPRPTAGAPPQPLPAGTSAAMAPPPGAPGAIGTTPQTSGGAVAATPQPGPQGGATPSAVTAGPPALNTVPFQLATPPPRPNKTPPPTTTARTIFLPPEEIAARKIRAEAKAKHDAQRAHWDAIGLSPEQQRQIEMADALNQGSTAGSTYAEGPTVPDANSPTGFSQILYLRSNPGVEMRKPAMAPGAQSTASPNERAMTAWELFGAKYPSQTPTTILRAISPDETAVVENALIRRAGDRAFSTGTGTGRARINTEMGMPLSPTEAAMQEVPFGTAMNDLRGLVPVTPEQRTRRDAVVALTPDITMIRTLAERVFPDAQALPQLLRAMRIPILPGMTETAMTSAYMNALRASNDPDFIRLQAAVETSLGNLAKVRGAESGRLTEQDVERARLAVTDLKGWTDTKASALAKLKDAEDALARVARDIRTPGSQMRPGAPPPAAAPLPSSAFTIGQTVTIRGQRHRVTQVYPDGSFDAVPAP